ncbi:MAG: hypothetical protein RQ754_15755 [Desulfuromonadales bacterium]|nr:hypothetical protein [Desulfuromonadales bacterium]
MDSTEKVRVRLDGLDEEMNRALNERIEYFEANHEVNVINSGEGWVPRLSAGDYLFAGVINLAITIWLIVALI